MFEDEGDSGFWSAMSNLTKKAKCPIFLTANVVPDSLASSTIRYLHLETSSPKPKECVAKLRRILKSEGLNLKGKFSEDPSANEQLSLIAQLCKCDLRRAINELELYATSLPLSKDCDASPLEIELSTTTTTASRPELLVPFICDISPKEVSPHDFSLLTIRGKHFKFFSTRDCNETSLVVTIGNQLCPAVQRMDDATILAVCPPCSLALGVADSGVIERTGRESRTSRFAPVSIYLYARDRVITRSDAVVTASTDLCDGTSCDALGRKWNIEYAFPPPRYGMLPSRAVDEESAEADFACERSAGNEMREVAMTDKNSPSSFTKEEAVAILEEGVGEWMAKHSESDTKEDTECTLAPAMHPNLQSAKELLDLSSLSGLSSDAAYLEDAFEFGGVPFLAGVVPGFGSSLVNDIAGNNVQSNPEGNERKLLRDANARP